MPILSHISPWPAVLIVTIVIASIATVGITNSPWPGLLVGSLLTFIVACRKLG
jgi:hypothetical protein